MGKDQHVRYTSILRNPGSPSGEETLSRTVEIHRFVRSRQASCDAWLRLRTWSAPESKGMVETNARLKRRNVSNREIAESGSKGVSEEALRYTERCKSEGLIPCGWSGPTDYTYADGNNMAVSLVSFLKLVALLTWLFVSCSITLLIIVPVVPFGLAKRQAVANYFGHAFGWGVVKILGSPYLVKGKNYAGYGKRSPVLYLSNHCSILDVILCMWQVPKHTVGIGKKEIVYLPVFGWLYYLSGQYRIDRKNRSSAIQSLNKAADWMLEKKLSMMLYPEGTRSTSGHLAHFKKGFAHMVIRTGLPIVPLVLTGTHKAWKNHTASFRAAPLTVTFLPPIDTSSWSVDKLDDHIRDIEYIFNEALPEDQRMLGNSI